MRYFIILKKRDSEFSCYITTYVGPFDTKEKAKAYSAYVEKAYSSVEIIQQSTDVYVYANPA